MRDPGTPRRNPYFDYADPDADSDGRFDHDDQDPANSYGSGGMLDALGGLVEALVDAQPEASEHLVAAAHELVLAVKTVVDATEAALAAQRYAMSANAETPDASDMFEEESIVGLRRVDIA